MIVSTRPFKTYLTALALGVAALSLPAFVLNMLVDPLWYDGGSRLSDENLAFDERTSKSNLFLKDPGRYDCLVLGSSRVTLMDVRQIRGHTCFNYAYSDGRVAEHLAFARYAKAKGMRPKLVIIGVEEFQFRPYKRVPVVPDFVREGTEPKPQWLTYLSLGALGFSINSIRKTATTLHRVYDREFICRLHEPRHVYDPPPMKLERAQPPRGPGAGFVPDKIALYREIGEVFPEARYLGYVPPISLWRVGQFIRNGTLDNYLGVMYGASKVFDRMLDFSVPSPVTTDKSLTVDGSHYEVAVSDRIAAMLSGAPMEFGLDVTALSREAYASRFKAALATELAKLKD